MSAFIIVDTDILIDAARQISEAIACLHHIVTQMELLVGCRDKRELQNTERFLQHFQLLTLNEAICDATLALLRQYRLSHGLMIPDAFIAATALTLNQPLISKNQRDYRFIPQLQLFPYPTTTA